MASESEGTYENAAQTHVMREFSTGATRDSDLDKPDYEGYFSPYALESFGAYMLKHQKQADGRMRKSDNWKKGIPQEAYRKSLYRHHMDFQKFAAEGKSAAAIEMANAMLFNIMGWLHEELKPSKAVPGSFLGGAPVVHESAQDVVKAARGSVRGSHVFDMLDAIHERENNPLAYRP